MGCGESVYVKQQEEFVCKNRTNFNKQLKGYTQTQIDCKLRQLYAKTDCNDNNQWSYVNPTDWKKAKSSVVISGKQLY
jgi:hypothetical protein